MALAAALTQKRDDCLALLHADKPELASVSQRSSGGVLPAGYVIVLTHCLPDGLGDITFGESAVKELEDLGAVAWVRCYSNEESAAAGERLIADTSASLAFSRACSSQDGLGSLFGELEQVWQGARQRFLAPWIFGISEHEGALLELAQKTRSEFWALTEYGRGMGNIHTYTGGLGHRIPTGWTLDGGPGGVFQTIRRAPKTDTDWRAKIAEFVRADRGRVRAWWFYSRKDDEKKHSLAFVGAGGDADFPAVSKAMPATADGQIALGEEKTHGEKLADQLFKVAADPSFKPTTDVTCAEVVSGVAGQFSQFLWTLLFDPAVADPEKVDVIVAPNLLTNERKASGQESLVVRLTRLDLVGPDGVREHVVDRKVYICSTRVPRSEMKTFLEQAEERVYTTGDQSLSEAIFLGKYPFIKPDAKVQQWQMAVVARQAGIIDQVPDLGAEIRRLVTDEAARERTRAASKASSDEVERGISAQLGGGPGTWNPTQWVLARAGMLG